ncbi:MAG TPA: M64 family metallopeptidase [Candidatus Polarisedimenticolia bacterium]|nr:M64 family metallopeptidase [Candidatus Polarisedimenticolia bacterium]
MDVALLGPAGWRHTRRVEIPGLCLEHDAAAAPHETGDSLEVHRETVIVELPEVDGFAQIEVAIHEENAGRLSRRLLAVESMDAARFDRAGGDIEYRHLSFANTSQLSAKSGGVTQASSVLWPGDFADPDVYRLSGDATETDRRINVVIIPDGYTYAEKALMDSHADSLMARFRSKSPFSEHDPFVNFILVYAYSRQSGTDQCDCGITVDTAMGTNFEDVVPVCGDTRNRCIRYQSGCDTLGLQNIAAAELRAPAHDVSLIMVNTTRYGGCGGTRAVFAAGNIYGADLALHELGHTLASLGDEYSTNDTCGLSATEVNTSLNGTQGAWHEWIAVLGPPRQGAQDFATCVYRPGDNCAMRETTEPFCKVCTQRWALAIFDHARVSPTAPIESMAPPATASAQVGVPKLFSVATRLPQGVSNLVTWRLSGPGFPTPTVVEVGTTSHRQSFVQPGTYQLSCEVAADASLIKPQRYGANVDTAVWDVTVTEGGAPREVSLPGSAEPLRFTSLDTLVWEDGPESGATSYNIYRGDVTTLTGGDYGRCLLRDLGESTATEAAAPPAGVGWFYLVTGENSAGEGPLGFDSSGNPLVNSSPC